MKTSGQFGRVRNRIEADTGKAIHDFGMIEHSDVVLACVSGGKDSYTLLSTLLALRKRSPVKFRIIALNVDQNQPGFPEHILPTYLESLGVEYRIVEADTYSIVKEKIPAGKTTCSLCSRLRRGVIYRCARELGATKIALGHHRDDVVETLFLNMFFGGKLKAMSPKLLSDDSSHVVIRPLYYCREEDIAYFARQMMFPIIPCDLCGSQENLQRKRVKEMLREWDRQSPGRVDSIFRSIQNIVPSHLADPSLFAFGAMGPGASTVPGDTLFDPDEYRHAPLVLSETSDTRIQFVRNRNKEAVGEV
ncbi:MAG: tRNA 2-thiocytidine(32) synthetase TtcA [Betaproteobacteria bacterium]